MKGFGEVEDETRRMKEKLVSWGCLLIFVLLKSLVKQSNTFVGLYRVKWRERERGEMVLGNTKGTLGGSFVVEH